jgi:CheY-like chemotaxis protein
MSHLAEAHRDGEKLAGPGQFQLSLSGPVTVFIVDDDEVDVMALQRAFREHNLNNPTVVAHDGLEALQLLRSGGVNKPYLIVLDLNMPRSNGIEFLDELRADPIHSSAVVFALTTSNNERDRLASYERNVAGYVVKSTLSHDLREFVGLLMRFCSVVQMP